ncbi:hypothetical protein [Bordetella flabilis]|uniref:Chromosome partition protein Smc n=1 Tax=Bordetella flabilis TaxID=463014 RepID=A0A193GMK9_9BORD|nr:hypothetical protein [Bordetella flabilis]ANN80838.1 hypothetical protein BAU07_26295 [Bordetella flabilis]
MINNGIPAGGGNRSNTSYIGSYQHALASDAGHAMELRRLAEEATVAADQAYAQGRQEGWDEAVREANDRLRQQLAFTAQHVADKERLKAELDKQAKIIDALEARVAAMEEENQRLRQENGLLRKADTSLRELIISLRSANEKLQQQVKELDASYRERTQQYADQLWQYNRTMVFVSAVGGVLEELTRENTPQAQHARELFAEKYAREVDKGLQQGTIKMAPDLDPTFDRYLPKTRQFIADLLVMAQEDKTESLSAGM